MRTAPPLRWVGVQKDIPAPRTWLSKPSFPIIVGFSSSPLPCSLVFTKLPFPLQRSTQSHKLYLVLCTSLPELPVSLSSCHASPEPRRIWILLLGSLSDSSVLLLTFFFFLEVSLVTQYTFILECSLSLSARTTRTFLEGLPPLCPPHWTVLQGWGPFFFSAVTQISHSERIKVQLFGEGTESPNT